MNKAAHLRNVKAQQKVFLCDVSGSMAEVVDYPSWRRIDQLRAALAQFDDPAPLWVFSSMPARSSMNEIQNLMPFGSTALDQAFEALAAEGYKQVVLLSDGEPDDPDAALEAARGLSLEIIYIGNPPMPSFMRELAQYAGGSATLIGTRRSELPQLVHQMQKLLGWQGHQTTASIKL